MGTPHVATEHGRSLDLSGVRAAVRLSATAFLALAVLSVVGLDQGAASLVGADPHVHEFIHDARHLLGFPCHSHHIR